MGRGQRGGQRVSIEHSIVRTRTRDGRGGYFSISTAGDLHDFANSQFVHCFRGENNYCTQYCLGGVYLWIDRVVGWMLIFAVPE